MSGKLVKYLSENCKKCTGIYTQVRDFNTGSGQPRKNIKRYKIKGYRVIQMQLDYIFKN